MITFLLTLVTICLLAANAVLYTALYGPMTDTWNGILKTAGNWGLPILIVIFCLIIPLVIAVRRMFARKAANLQTRKLRTFAGITTLWNILFIALFFLTAPKVTPVPVKDIVKKDGMWLVHLVNDPLGKQTGTHQTVFTADSKRGVPLPTDFTDDHQAVEYVLKCAIKGRYALMYGTPEHLEPLSECLSRKGAAWMGLTLAGMELGGAAFAGIASGLADQLGGSQKADDLRQRMQQRVGRLKSVLDRYHVPVKPGRWNDEMVDSLAPDGRNFLLDILPFFKESTAMRQAREAQKGEDVEKNHERRFREVIATAEYIAGFASYEQPADRTVTIRWPSDKKPDDLPDRAVIEDGHWRIDWPRSKK